MKRKKAIIWEGFRVALAYRFDFVITLITSPVSLIVFYFLWQSIFTYSGKEIIQGFTFEGMISYYVLSLLIGLFVWSNVERWMEYDIVDGDMVVFFLRPVKLITQYYFFELGLNFFALLLQAVPVFIIGFIFFGLQFSSWLNVALFAISVFIASLIYFMISFIIGLGAFWFKRITGFSKAKGPIIGFLSGALLPLTFFPEQIQNVLAYLPFQYIRFIPIQIYLGELTLSQIFFNLGIQVFWAALLILLAILIEKRAFKRFAGAGI